MNHTLRVRYILFGLLFLLVTVGLVLRSYTMLAILAIVGIILAVVGDRIENKPTEPYQQYNVKHHRGHS